MDGKDLLSTGNVFWGYRKMMRIKAEKLTEVNQWSHYYYNAKVQLSIVEQVMCVLQ